jgi:hypothetical protein
MDMQIVQVIDNIIHIIYNGIKKYIYNMIHNLILDFNNVMIIVAI